MALQALSVMNVDVCLLTEAKLTDGIYTRSSNGYSVVSTSAVSHRQGGVALCVHENEYFQVESVACHGPNVMSWVLVTGTRWIPLVGVYIPPADISTLEHVNAALSRFEDGPVPILLGDLNVDLDHPEGDRATQVATVLSDHGLLDMLLHFKHRRPFGSRCTWRQQRTGEVVTGCCNYIMGRDRRTFTMVSIIRVPRHFSSDHQLVLGILRSASERDNRTYRTGRVRFPLRQAPNRGTRIRG